MADEVSQLALSTNWTQGGLCKFLAKRNQPQGDICKLSAKRGGYTGHDAWMTKLHNVPQDMDCSLIDINKDNVNDCIVVGENGLLAAIEPLYGNVLWYMHDHNTNMQPSKLDFPIMFPDVNGDDINELLVPCSLSDRRNSLVLVSGRRGNILGKPLNFTGCLTINSVSLEKDWSITYICHLAGDKAWLHLILTLLINRSVALSGYLPSLSPIT
uniref:FAM234A/B beta-propeller domain-containing protein n=1 Tax=Timema douglasi TaxID=61478 RepID=A0A7R8VD83_TIMDO|nr:unnamed protein product [Timema douglasi]